MQTTYEDIARTSTDVTPRKAALIAGAGYAAIFVLAIFANFMVFEGLVETGDPAATAENIIGSEGLFRAGIVAFTIVFALDVLVAWALWVVFRPWASDLSILAAWLRLTYTVLLGAALVFAFLALNLLGGGESVAAFGPGEVESGTLLALDAFDAAWLIGLVAFGAHLIIVGRLVARAGGPRLLGRMLMVAGAAYIVDTLAHTVLTDYTSVETLFLAIVAIPSVIGEGWLMIWLLRRGGKRAVVS